MSITKSVKAGFAEVYQGKHSRGFDVNPYNKAEAKATGGKMLAGRFGQDLQNSLKDVDFEESSEVSVWVKIMKKYKISNDMREV